MKSRIALRTARGTERARRAVVGFGLACLVSTMATGEGLGDVSDRVIDLGNKLREAGGAAVQPGDRAVRPLRGRALNVWDLQAFAGKVYLGGGDTTRNAGPINLWAFDHAAGRFEAAPERVIRSEAIENFRVIDGELYVPNSDPTRGDRLKFDRLGPDGGWQTVAGPPALAHVRDMIGLPDGSLLLVGNSRRPLPRYEPDAEGRLVLVQPGLPSAVRSEGRGARFTPAIDGESPAVFGNFFFSVFSHQGRVFATTYRLHASAQLPDSGLGVLEYDAAAGRFMANTHGAAQPNEHALRAEKFIPLSDNPFPELVEPGSDRTGQVALLVRCSVEYKRTLVYTLVTYSAHRSTYHAYYRNAVGLCVKAAPDAPAVRVVLPDPRAIGEDVLVSNGRLYVLANTRHDDGQYTVYVYTTRHPLDASAWTELLRFGSGNLARSFERIDQTFYFGLGFDPLAGNAVGDAGGLRAVTLP